jgi:hypothetical protein
LTQTDGLSSANNRRSGEEVEEDARPEGEEESEELAAETGEQSEELKNEKIEELETEHEKAKRRKRGNNTQ